MKRAVGFAVLTAIPLILLGLGPLNPGRKSASAPQAAPMESPPTSLKGLASSQSWLQVVESLVSLSTVQRSLAAASSDSADPLPDAELLTAQVATTGLGPIQIGMTVEEVQQAGINLISSQESPASGNCRTYRVEGLVEPIDFMAVDNRIIRIDVWPGSFAETLSGAKIGSADTEIYALYGDRIEVASNPAGNKQLIFTPADPGEDLYRLVFEIDASGTVIQYRAGQFPAVTWPEGCG